MSDWTIRDATPEDAPFLVYSWLRSFSETYPARTAYPGDRSVQTPFWADHKPIVEALLASQVVRVVVDPGDQGIIWGWACTDAPRTTLHYAVVKRSAKAQGLAGELLADLLGDMTTRAVGWTFHPREVFAAGMVPRGIWYPDTTWFVRNARGVAA